MDHYVRASSPIGDVYVAFSDAGVSCVVPVTRAPRFEASYVEQFGRAVRLRSRVPADIARILKRGADPAAGPQLSFDLRALSEFDRTVLLETARIPRGETRSYGQMAVDVGAPRAARAVGTALSHNPCPCSSPATASFAPMAPQANGARAAANSSACCYDSRASSLPDDQ